MDRISQQKQKDMLLLCISQLYDVFSTCASRYINTCITMHALAYRDVPLVASRYDDCNISDGGINIDGYSLVKKNRNRHGG